MTPDNAVKWLRTEDFNQWELLRGDIKVSTYSSDDESVEAGIERFEQSVKLQYPGKYTLKAQKGKSRNAAAMSFDFDVKRESETPAPRANPAPVNAPFNVTEWMDAAEKSAYNKFVAEQWRKDVDRRLDTIEKALETLANAGKDLTDDDDENDESAIDKISKMAEQMPALMGAFEAMNGSFKK